RNEEYSGNWGYTAPNGVELAISGTASGTSFIDATVPTAPVEVAFIPGPASIWREIATYGPYAYIVTEADGAALQVVSLVNPLNPVLVNTLNPPQVPFSRAHEIKADRATGRLYVAGTHDGSPLSGLKIFDLIANPIQPTYLGVWPESGYTIDNYVHDLSIQNGLAYCASIYTGFVYVLNVSNPTHPTSVTSWTYPTAFTHNTWPTADGSFLVTTDENTGGHLRSWDLRQLPAVSPADEWISPTGALVHNAYIRGNLCYMSHYQDGLRIVDISDPFALQPVAWFDTHPLDGGGSRGAWGCYCFAADPNIVYISDRDTGTYILRYTPTPVAVLDPEAAAPAAVLLGASPNPMAGPGQIRFRLPAAGPATLRVYDPAGRLVSILSRGLRPAGEQAVAWSGRSDSGAPLAQGVYYLRLEHQGGVETRPVVIAR
ncbi:MAG TPA: choice-of-anchor B family protein, partial [Candidatus Udaeobacter sp.]|nr:choice-of-anchor B family protein [Candidatus Udaeobacter sp.]